MLVNKYKCVTINRNKGLIGCFNEFWGPEGAEYCPVCGNKGTLQTEERAWDVRVSGLGQKQIEELQSFGYCPSLTCMQWVKPLRGKYCPNCGSETIEYTEIIKGRVVFTERGEKQYQKIRQTKGPEGVMGFWFTLHALTTPKELQAPPEEYDKP